MPWQPPPPLLCTLCGTKVFPVEELHVDGAVYHKKCFRCQTCSRVRPPRRSAAGAGCPHAVLGEIQPHSRGRSHSGPCARLVAASLALQLLPRSNTRPECGLVCRPHRCCPWATLRHTGCRTTCVSLSLCARGAGASD